MYISVPKPKEMKTVRDWSSPTLSVVDLSRFDCISTAENLCILTAALFQYLKA